MLSRKQSSKTVFLNLFVLIGTFLLLCQPAAPAQAKQVKRVLIFYELGLSSPAVSLLDEKIRAALENAPFQIELYREYMETTLFPDPETQQEFREWYIHKYRNRKPDLIIALGRSPLRFMVDVHDKAFPEVPIVFGGTDEWLAGYPRLDSHFTGVWERFEAERTLEIALQLQPATKHVVVVGGASVFDGHLEALFEDRLKPYESRFDISYLTRLDMPTLLERVRHLPENTVILYTHVSQDAAGTRFVGAAQVDPLLAEAANAPIFGPSDVDLGHGEVGGDLVSFYDEGGLIAAMTLEILHGKRAYEIPIVNGANVYMFDWRALDRWGFKESDLPPGSIVLNRPPDLWDSYKRYIIGVVSLILFEALLIFALAWQSARRRKAENELAITYDRLVMAIEAGRFVGWNADVKAGRSHWFGDLQGMFGIPSDTYIAQAGEFLRRIHADDVAFVTKAMDTARENRGPYTAEFRIPRDDGSVRWVTARGKFYYGPNDEPERMLGLAVDITERKLAQDALQNINRRLIEAQEQERIRIARELHDDINQRLALLGADLDLLSARPDSTTALREKLEQLRQQVSETSTEVQAISHRLHSSKLEYLGLRTACQALCKEVAGRHKVSIEFKAEGVPPAVPQDVSLALFRVLQESLQNAIKHSGAQRFEVGVRGLPEEILLRVHDNGAGFDVDAAMLNAGLGLISMRERIKSVNGTLSISSKPGGGTEINARVPIIPARDAGKPASGAA